MEKWKTKSLQNLAQAFLSLKNETEMMNFLRDLCTLEELKEFSQRWEIAQLLHTGKTYREIAKLTGVSTTTVTRIAHWLTSGMDGYKLALQRK